MTTADLAAPAPLTARECANADASAAHFAYLEAYNVAFKAIYEVAVGDKPSAHLYDALSNLNRAAEAHATACWKQGAASARAVHGVI